MKRSWIPVACLLAFSACVPDYVKKDRASVYLRITKVSSQSGGGNGTGGDFLNSDVTPLFNDNAILNFDVQSKNPTISDKLFRVNDVQLEQYEVRYFRTDGRNQEGVDVPYRITGALGTIIPAPGTGQVSIVVVRHQAKLEPPLKNLVADTAGSAQGPFLGGELVLTVMAEITVRGHTTAGQAVEAKGTLQINFADFAGTT
ncbi:MAG: hypothetical protein DMF81_15635 [Acidobacteria bacterium]|nr:MAG: hypothetical protein DMF81_15635 [Acidobacteriota bacterium]